MHIELASDAVTREPTREQVEAIEALWDMLDRSRRWCTCEYPGQGALDCPSYLPALDGPAPWTRQQLNSTRDIPG